MEKETAKKISKKIVTKKKLLKKHRCCAYCGCTNELVLTIDHINPKSRGGSDDEKNLQVLCLLCNKLKGSLLPNEFKAYLKHLVKLKELCKISIQLPEFHVKFNENHYPNFFKEVANGQYKKKGNVIGKESRINPAEKRV